MRQPLTVKTSKPSICDFKSSDSLSISWFFRRKLPATLSVAGRCKTSTSTASMVSTLLSDTTPAPMGCEPPRQCKRRGERPWTQCLLHWLVSYTGLLLCRNGHPEIWFACQEIARVKVVARQPRPAALLSTQAGCWRLPVKLLDMTEPDVESPQGMQIVWSLLSDSDAHQTGNHAVGPCQRHGTGLQTTAECVCHRQSAADNPSKPFEAMIGFVMLCPCYTLR